MGEFADISNTEAHQRQGLPSLMNGQLPHLGPPQGTVWVRPISENRADDSDRG